MISNKSNINNHSAHTKKTINSQLKDTSNRKKINFITITEDRMNSEISDFLGRSKLVKSYRNTIDITANPEFVFQPFSVKNCKEKINDQFGGIFRIETQKENEQINKLIFKESFIIIHKSIEKNDGFILAAKIKNQEIVIANKFKVGQKTSDFWASIIKNAYKYDFSKIDTLMIGDEMGDINLCFIFETNRLNEIQINPPVPRRN